MGKKRTTILGSEQEEEQKKQKAVKLEQKKLREGRKPANTEDSDTSQTEASPAPVADHPAPEPVSRVSSKSGARHGQTGRSKAYKSAKSQVDSDRTYPLPESLSLLRRVSVSKFDPTVELHLILKTTPKERLSVNLPHAAGKGRRVAVADDEFIASLEKGKPDLNLDYLVATPSQMAKLVKFAKLLGPKGLMPNPKTGTISDHPEETAKKLAADTSVALKFDKSGPVIHTSVGKLSLKDDQLSANIQAVISVLTQAGLRKVVLKSTQSPAIKLQV